MCWHAAHARCRSARSRISSSTALGRVVSKSISFAHVGVTTEVDASIKLVLSFLTMTSSNAVVEPIRAVDALAIGTPEAETPEAVDGGPTTPAPFELLPVGEAFGVCDLDGECY